MTEVEPFQQKLTPSSLLHNHSNKSLICNQAQSQCKVFFIYLTAGYFESVWCKQELEFAAKKKLPVVLLTYDKTPQIKADMDKIVAQQQSVGAPITAFYYSFDDGDDDAKMAKVVHTIKQYLTKY